MAFTDRLIVLARSHELLVRSDWEGAPLVEILERTLSPLWRRLPRAAGRPAGEAACECRGAARLAFHELATNAAKYGALSVAEGHGEVLWSLRRLKSSVRLVEIIWRESGGPPAVPLASRGFGSRLLEQGLANDFGSTVKLDFHPDGLECHICLPVAPAADEEARAGPEKGRQRR